MKNLKYIAVALASVAMTSCADLDTEYQGGYVNSEQIEEANKIDPAKQQAQIVGIMAQYKSISTASSEDYDFGYPSLMLISDQMCADMYGVTCGYNWFQNFEGYSSPTPSGGTTAMFWNILYPNIKICNDFLAGADPESTEELTQFYRAQALAIRSFDYWILANMYQYNYLDHVNSPCVPIITEENMEDYVINGAPRASVADVYTLIMNDINEAIDILSNSKVTAASILASKPKRLISTAAAYGLRARYEMSMEKYADAAKDAQAAITNFSGSPLTIEEASVPGFNDISSHSWMWGIAIDDEDDCVRTGIVNFPSHICSLAYGYVMYGGWRFCDTNLYNSISRGDVRKGWFTDDNFQSANLTQAEQDYITANSSAWNRQPLNAAAKAPAHTNVKFGAYQGILRNSTNASDVPMMRVEEMYLILAEAQAMSGNPTEGASTLQNFISTYRNERYVCELTTPQDIQDEVFLQKRIELWGEGLIYYDYQRLRKTIDRRGGGACTYFTYNLPADAPQRILCIPLSEITANKQITEEDNNKSDSEPTPVAG